MQEGNDPLTLSEIAEDAAFSMSDVAFIPGVRKALSIACGTIPAGLKR